MMKETVTIIVPIFKVEDYLDRCVESLVDQTYSNIEILLIDDGSPDNCPFMCDEWAKKDSRIKAIHKKNGGLSSARNLGINIASGEYLLFVDSDDYLDTNAVEKLYAYSNNADIVVAEATIYENGKIIHRCHTNLRENKIYTGAEYCIEAIRKEEWFAAACYNFYKRDYLIQNNLFFIEGILHEDNEFITRLFLYTNNVKYLHFEFYKYVIREGSITMNVNAKRYLDLFKTYEKWLKLSETLDDGKLKKSYKGMICKSYIHTCREFHLVNNEVPEGLNNKYLIMNALNMKELIKTLAFVMFRKAYIGL